MTELSDAKRILFYLLHSKKPDDLTSVEIDVMYYLSKDKCIQKIFDDGVKASIDNRLQKGEVK